MVKDSDNDINLLNFQQTYRMSKQTYSKIKYININKIIFDIASL